MTERDLKDRLKRFALRLIRVGDALPRRRSADVIARQLVRCGTSVGANYRSACRAKSCADFVAKLAIAEEEGDEVAYWLELIAEANLISRTRLEPLRREAEELLAILVASIKTARPRSNLGNGRGKAINPKSKVQNPKLVQGASAC